MQTGEIRKKIDAAIVAGDASGAAKMLAEAWLETPPAAGGILDGQQEESQAGAVRTINAGLRALAREHRGVYILDYEGLVARHGRENWGDERKWLTVRLPISSANLPHLAAEWMR